MVQEPELAALEEHILGCAACAERAEECASWVDAIRAALVIRAAIESSVVLCGREAGTRRNRGGGNASRSPHRTGLPVQARAD